MSQEHYSPLGGRIVTPFFVFLSVLATVALYLLLQRFIYGLGAVTHINDGYSWGIWVVFDVVIGTAFGCGGFVIAFLVYIINRGEYHPLIRPAVMASLFGYTLGGAAVFIDLGRYWQIYNIFLPWYSQPNSVMFEVAVCVTAYIIVLWIEFTPVFLERLQIKDLHRKLNKVLFFIVALGILLPTMHQSSLGTLMVIMGYKLHPLWNTQLLPVLFLTTAILIGYAIVVFEAILSSASFNRPYETDILGKLSKIIWWLIVVYLSLRFADVYYRNQLELLTQPGLLRTMFVIENLLFLIPMVLLLNPKSDQSPRTLFIAAFSLLLAGSVLRVNTYLIAYNPGHGWSYFPSVEEMLVTIGMFSIEVMLYLVFVKTLPVLHKIRPAETQTA
jgi:Ni/Fe-hydrogenase subunit HybB-like protein